jgi:CBS domain containing-hemolysin-like protein
MARMQRARVSVALVANDDGKSSESGIQGLVTRQQIASAVIDGMDLFFG